MKKLISRKPLSLSLAGMIALGAGGLWLSATSNAADEPAKAASASATAAKVKPALTVTTTKATSGNLVIKLTANGSVAAWQEALIGSEASGLRIQELHANIGDVVQRGQLLVSFASEAVRADLALAQASLAEAQANLAEAAANAERTRALQTSGALSAQQVGQYLTAEQTAKARVESAKAGVDAQQLRMRHTRVVAPDSGIITARVATLGSVVGNGAELFRMIRQGRLEWRAEVTASEMAKIVPGTEVVVTAPGGAQWKGKVRVVSPTVDAQTRMGLVYVDLVPDTSATTAAKPQQATASLAFKPGMYAKGEFVMGSSQALTIPQQAVVVRDGFSYAFRLNADNRVTQIKLQTGRRVSNAQGDLVEVVSGLNADSTIVSSGAGFLNDGDTVKVVAAVKSANAAVKN
ncbi:efflux RND transporter periplasmic adaptor subunit [Undibacterium umbellatum]|jgi:RND family efflux transporter MFP subunit|uniref:Efflux RND transporter periplasmic adaptor subunit n=1 Tax=Undibacterium umbellatum TaxID=2762300 RepID=A0ABR6Z466_9BURK|nr:efflux RND transporter periplasmic adaptor subunit [Undibacterium umbellatum]MBC3906591.1 efflux RND transporter periplasmic adaptor subunit [Undibacterium umbellatum]